MKKWFILIYILSVLAIAGLAKATTTSVEIENYSFNENLFSLSVSGTVLGDCGAEVTSEIIDSQATEELPILLLEINNNGFSCSSSSFALNHFDLTIDLRNLNAVSGRSYYLMFNNIFQNNSDPLVLIKTPSVFSQSVPKTDKIRGVLKRNGDYNFYLDVNGVLFSVKSVISLENYLNKKVVIDALKIIYQVGPGFDLNSHSPLRENLSDQPTDSLFILGISTI
jgi:hypothetical protein